MQFNKTNHTVEVGEEILVPSNDTHLVFTVSQTPSCWMYIFTNLSLWNNDTVRNWMLHPGNFNGLIGMNVFFCVCSQIKDAVVVIPFETQLTCIHLLFPFEI